MAKLAFIDDHQAFADLLATPLREAGHEVHVQTAPVDFERLMQFGPQVIVFGLSRKRTAFNRAVESAQQDVLGYKAIMESEQYPAVNVIPLLLVGVAIEESDIPTAITYDGFLLLPDELDLYVPLVEELATKVKTRRRISGYICPVCGSRLTFTREPVENLFCPKCHTSVALIDDENCTYMHASGRNFQCRIEDLTPKTRHHE